MTVSSQIIEVIDALCARFGIAIDWTAENVMPMLQEMAGKFITWEIATSWAWIGIAVFMLVATAVGISVGWKIYTDGYDGLILFLMVTIGSFVIGASLIIIGYQIMDIIEATTFPDKTIFEYVKGVLSNN